MGTVQSYTKEGVSNAILNEVGPALAERLEVPDSDVSLALKAKIDAAVAASVSAFPVLGAGLSFLRRTRAGIGKASTRTGFLRVLFVGNSITAGALCTEGIHVNSIPARLQNILASSGLTDGSTGWSYPAHSIPVPNPEDPRWSFSGGFAQYTATGSGKSMFVTATTANAIAKFVSDKTGSVVSFWYATKSGAFTYSIDGATPVAVAAGNLAATTWSQVVVSGLKDSTHTLEIKTTSPTVTWIGPAWVGKAFGVAVDNAGNAGAQQSSWNPDIAQWFENINLAKIITPDANLVLIESCLINDAGANVSAATHQANLAKTIAAFPNADRIVWIPPTPNPAVVTAAKFQELRLAAYSAANAAGVPVLDISTRWGLYPEANAAGYMADSVHPSSAGNDDIARAFANMMGVPSGSTVGEKEWKDLTLVNGWIPYGEPFCPPQYRKDENGMVELRGLMKGGTTTDFVVFSSLPVGYRPGKGELFVTAGSVGKVAVVQINQSLAPYNGLMTFHKSDSAFTSLSGIRFAAEN